MADDYQYIKLPDGSYGKFSANATDDAIRTAILKDFPSAFGDLRTGAGMEASAANQAKEQTQQQGRRLMPATLVPGQQEADYRRAYAAQPGVVLSDMDTAMLGLGAMGAGRTIAKQGLKAAVKPLVKGAIGATGGSAAGSYGGRAIGNIFGNPEAGAQIGATIGGLAGGFFGGMGNEPLPEEGPYVPASKSPGPYRGPSSIPKPAIEPTVVPAAQSPGAYRGPSSVTPPLGSQENPGFYAKLSTRMPKAAVAESPQLNTFAGATPSNAPLSDVPLPAAGAYSPPSLAIPGLSRAPAPPIKPSPFGNATPSNALNADIPIPQAGAYKPPSVPVPGITEAVAPPSGVKGSVAKPSGRLVLLPEEAQAEENMQRIATQRASQHGMLYAAGMRPAGGGRVPMTATPTVTEGYGGPRSAYEPPDAQYSPTGGAAGPYSPPQYAYRVHDAAAGPEDMDLERSHAHATMSPEEAQTYAESRNPGTPQKISRNDLAGLKEGVDFKLMDGPNGTKWVKYLTQRPASEFEPFE
jgi:hypothetical protein